MCPLGVIDIGSNSVRLVVYAREPGAITPLFNEKILCGLGRSVGSQGHLGEEAMSRALKALARFRSISDRLGVKELRAVATAAVREASDGATFVEKAQKQCGVHIDVLTGGREAELAAKGIMMGFIEPDGVAGDLGGGSLELIDLEKNKSAHAITLPIGGLRLIDATKGSIERAKGLIEKELDRVDWLHLGKGRTFFGVGGTWRALAKLHMAATNYPLFITQGYAMPPSEAKAFARTVCKSKRLSDFSGIEEISKARRDVVPYGALVLERVLARIKPKKIVFSVFGLREGLLYEMMSAQDGDPKIDPLLAFCEHFAEQNSRSAEHAHELCRWTDQIFEPPAFDETPSERRLRYAACLLSDIGWRRHPDYREDQVPGMVAYSGMSGIDHPGRMFLALMVYYRHAGVGAHGLADMWGGLRTSVGRKSDDRARIIAAAVRCAHTFSAGMPGVIDDIGLKLNDKTIVLSIPSKHAALDGERTRRRFSSLASLLAREPVVRIV